MMVRNRMSMMILTIALPLMGASCLAETCTTQSQMLPADRSAVSAAGKDLAAKMQAGDTAGVRSASSSEITGDFSAVSELVTGEAPKLKGGAAVVESVYLLDASMLKPGADGSAAEAQFFCNLNHSTENAEFLIPGLPAGRYAFAIVEVRGSSKPERLSFLLRWEQNRWTMAGVYPKPLTAAGHDGLWYWTDARKRVAQKQPWVAWFDYRQAEELLIPADFVHSSHREKLESEAAAAAPPVLSQGISAEAPLVIKGKDGKEYRFTGLGVDDSLNASAIDVTAHMSAEPTDDPAAARKQNIAAMSALLAAYPELRSAFHGVWIFADMTGRGSYATEQAMSDIP